MSDNPDDSQGDDSDDEGPVLTEIELDENGLPSRSPDSVAVSCSMKPLVNHSAQCHTCHLQGIMDWLALNRLPLPPRLETLRIDGPRSASMAEQWRAIEKLPPSYPHLREVWLTSGEGIWRRKLPSGQWEIEPLYVLEEE